MGRGTLKRQGSLPPCVRFIFSLLDLSLYHEYILETMDAKTAKEPRVRSAALARDTNETKIQLAINLDGGEFPAETDERLTNGTEGHASQSSKSQTIAINSGIGFLDHMLHALAKHAGWSLALNCKGDLHSTFCPSRLLYAANRSSQLTTTIPPKMSALLLEVHLKKHSEFPLVSHDSDPHTLLWTKPSRARLSTCQIALSAS